MELRVFGRTGLQLSMLGFGCGAVGGLMVRGEPRRPGTRRRPRARCRRQLFRYGGAIWQWRVGEQSRPHPAKPEAGRCDRRHQGAGAADDVRPHRRGRRRRRSRQPAAAAARTASTSSICTIRSPRRRRRGLERPPGARRGRAGLRAAARGRARSASSASPRSATPRRCTRSSMPAPSTARRSSTTCSIRPPREALPANYPAQDYGRCSTTPRRPASASSASACSPAARCRARPSAIRSRARRPSRSARP